MPVFAKQNKVLTSFNPLTCFWSPLIALRMALGVLVDRLLVSTFSS